MTMKKPKVAIIGTGGSISTPGRHELDLFEYADYGRTLEVDELLAMFPVLGEVVDIVPVRFRAIVSIAITPADWRDLVRRIHELVVEHPDLDGIVVTHGTATAEETGYFLHLTLKTEIPVVLVGAQRPPNGLSTDAGINMVDAVRVAGSEAARGLGVLLVINNEVHCPRDVTKTSNFRLHTFRSPELGLLGHADPDGAVAIYRHPVRRHTRETEFDLEELGPLPHVDIVYSFAGADGHFVRAALDRGARGVVIAGLAPGLLPPPQREAVLEACRAGVVVVVSNRGGVGRMIPRVKDVEAGIIAGDNLNAQKCRVLLMLALAVSEDRDEIRRMFATY